MDREFTKKNTSLAINEIDKELSFMEGKEDSSGDKSKEDVGNKVTAWSSPVNDIHYPSEKLVKDNLDLKEDSSNKVTGWSNTVTDNQYPSAKLVKDSIEDLNVDVVQMDIPEPGCSRSYLIKQGDVALPTKIDIPAQGVVVDDHLDSSSTNPVQNKVIKQALPTKTSDLNNTGADGTHPFITDVSDKEDKSNKVGSVDASSTDEQYPSAKALFEAISSLILDVEKQGTADDGFASTYVFSQGGVELPVKINIPKDSMYRSVTVRVCEERGVPLPELAVGDKYIDFEINTVDGSSEHHLYLPARDFLFAPDEVSLTVNQAGVLSVKANGVSTSRLGDGAVTYDKLHSTLVVDNLATDSDTRILSARQGKVLNEKKIDKSSIIDDLGSEASTEVLSARQGKVLKEMIDNIDPDSIVIVDDDTIEKVNGVIQIKSDGVGTQHLRSHCVTSNIIQDGAVDTDELANNSVTTGKLSDNSVTYAKLDANLVVDNLTTDDASKVLSAKQGKVLNDLIGEAITYINM